MNNKFRQELISELKKVSGLNKPNLDGFGLKYVGTLKPSYHLDTKSTRLVIKEFLKNHRLSPPELIDLITSLYYGETYDEVAIAGYIVGLSPELRSTLDPQTLHYWLDNTHGWAECDVLCQMAFDAQDFLDRWHIWGKAIKSFAKDKNVQVRRASLVLLTKPLRQSDDSRLADLAIRNVDLLKGEKDILITKAVSWALRAMIKNHKEKVSQYLHENSDSLPKIAVREVTSKLETGRKYVNRKMQNSVTDRS